MKVTIVTDAAKLNTLLDSIKKSGAKLEQDIHTAAVSALDHAAQHGNIGFMTRLIDVLPGFSRRNALIAWAIEFGPFKPSEDGKSVEHDKHGKVDLSSGEKTPFWEFKPEAPFKPFDLQAELAKLVKRAEKAAGDDRNKLDSDDLIAVRRLATAVKPMAIVETTDKVEDGPANDEASDDALAGVA